MLRKGVSVKGMVKAGSVVENEMSLKDLTEARILKISKDDLRLHEQQLMWTPNLEKEVVGYWRTLNGYWKNKKIPKCTCEQYEQGFMAKEKWNPYYFEGEPCSIKWYKQWRQNDNPKS